MPKILLFVTAALIAGAPSFTAHAASTLCQSVNGRSVCTQSGDALSCQSVNGRTHCLNGSGTLRCDTINGRTTCSTTRATPLIGTPDEDEEEEEEDRLPRNPGVWDRDLSVERDGQGLRVRAGTLDLRLAPTRMGSDRQR